MPAKCHKIHSCIDNSIQRGGDKVVLFAYLESFHGLVCLKFFHAIFLYHMKGQQRMNRLRKESPKTSA